MNSNTNNVFFYEDKTLNSNANRLFLYEDKTFPSYVTPIDSFYKGNSSNSTFEDRILEKLVEEVQPPSQQEFEEDAINCITPPPQEFKPQPLTSQDYSLPVFNPQPSTSQSQDYWLPEFKPQPSTSQSQDYRFPEFKSQASTSQDYQPPEQTQDREDSLMRIANQFCAILPPKPPVLAPPPTPIMRCLPNFNTFKVNDKKSSKSKISNSKIKQVIEELRGLTPTVDIRTLCFLNVLDHKYYGSNKEDRGVLIKVDFNEAVDYAFRRKFVAFTREGKDLFFIKFCKCRSSGEYFHLLQFDRHQRGKMILVSFSFVCIISLIFLFFIFSAGFIRHHIQCPVDGSKLGCRILHEPNNLEDLKNHVLYEQKMGYDYSHGSIEIDETTSDFTNPEQDLKNIYYYKKCFLYDLKLDVRSWIFQPITKLEYERAPESSVLPQRKTSKKTRLILDHETGNLYSEFE